MIRGFSLASFVEGLTAFVLRHRISSSIFVGLFIAAFAFFLPRLGFDNSTDAFFLKGDRTLVSYQRFKDLFETDEYSLIVMDAPAEWTPEVVHALDRLVKDLAALDHVVDVTALTNVRHIEGDAFALDVAPFLGGDPGVEELKAKRAEALAHPYYSGLFISKDGRHFGILVETEIIAGEIDYKIELTRRIRELISREPYAGWHAVAVGAPVLDADVRSIVSAESGMFGAIAFVLVGLGFLFVFRSLIGLFLPLVIGLLTIVATFGIMALIGAPVTLLTPIVPSFLISVGIGPSIFLTTAFLNARREGLEPGRAVMKAMKEAGPPSILAAGTTAAALLAFSSSDIRPVMEVGVVMGLGLLVALVVTLILVPVILGGYRGHATSSPAARRLEKRVLALRRLADFTLARPVGILTAFAIVFAIALIGMTRLQADYYYLGNFKKETRIRQDYTAVDRALPVSSAIEVLIDLKRLDAFKEPEALRRLARLQRAIAERADIPTKTYSLADVVKEINQAIHDGDRGHYVVPDTRREVAQALLLFESSGSDELTDLTVPDYDIARLTVRVPTLSDAAYKKLIALIRAQLDDLFGKDAADGSMRAQVTITGLVPMWVKISDYLRSSQIRSFAISFVVISLVMIFVFRSTTLGLIMSGVNAAVVSLVLGAMGWAGVPLDPYTILIAAIALGILDDDTIHFVRTTQTGLLEGRDIHEAVRAAYASAGQGMMYTTTVLVVSFSAYVFSQVASLTKFGLLTALVLLLGLVVEFLVTPAALVLLHRRGALRIAAERASGAASAARSEAGSGAAE